MPTDQLTLQDAMRQVGGEAMADTLWRAFDQIEWAEQEIKLAQERHPQARERLWQAFPLMRGTLPLLREELVFRAHARELLDRIAAGEDTREATNAELAAGLSEYSLQRPLNLPAACLYMRAFSRAFPGNPALDAEAHAANEKVVGTEADALEAEMREAGRCEWRTLEGGPDEH